ncbi:MAG TPA: YbjN domain-containing protein [Mycobacterium sp.]|uniref:YbjN domain-containing protein n=1 Tax=Mycolicibacterium sp. TaxID=2320850 RepID=UPI0025D0EA0C|nr:YbjN domain-containing protein [Mycolicibacterium sp.]HPX35393.1 YbjN domain-containing protein [Mycobacterium sp.]HQC76846.1 YbjN domain-containing protein [Mycobacterium sp.]
MNELIEKYLDVRGIRYYRGYRDDVYFFMVDIGDHARLHVHLEVSGADRDGVQISITPDRYYPAAYSDRILQALARWNSDCRAIGALLQESSDPNLVGVAAGSVYRGVDPAEFGAFVDGCLAAAVELFRSLGALVPPVAAQLRDAG